MIFFYSILGIFMFTHIISIFEMATTINNQQIFDRPFKNKESVLISKREKDRRFLMLLSQIDSTLGTGSSLCKNIIDGMTNPENSNYSILSSYDDLSDFRPGIPISSTHSLFVNGCDLNKGNHRVIIIPSLDFQNPYLYFSCISDGVRCRFEED